MQPVNNSAYYLMRDSFEATDICGICQEVLGNGRAVVAHLDGGDKHPYHRDCLKPWAEEHGNCPSCRIEVNQDALNSDNVFTIQEIAYREFENKFDFGSRSVSEWCFAATSLFIFYPLTREIAGIVVARIIDDLYHFNSFIFLVSTFSSLGGSMVGSGISVHFDKDPRFFWEIHNWIFFWVTKWLGAWRRYCFQH